jgi:hypothetical protein
MQVIPATPFMEGSNQQMLVIKGDFFFITGRFN